MAKLKFVNGRHEIMPAYDYIKSQLNAENYDVGELEEIKHNIENLQELLAGLINNLLDNGLLSVDDLQVVADCCTNHGIGYVYADVQDILKDTPYE